MQDWNLADCLEWVAEIRGEQPAIVQGNETVCWRAFNERSNSVAAWLTEAGVASGSQVALYTYNHIAYLEASFACMKASMVPVNINHQYKEQELQYLFDNSDASAVLVHEEFVETFQRIVAELPHIKAVLVLGTDVGGNWPEHLSVARYQDVAAQVRSFANQQRSGLDLVFIYTGGTTGMPKGVMWRQRDLYTTLAGGPEAAPPETEEEFRRAIRDQANPVVALILPPLMHGTAFFGSFVALLAGGTVLLTAPASGCDAKEICSIVEQGRPTVMSIVGDTFALPILQELDTGSYDISSLQIIASSGSPWSHHVKAGLLAHNQQMKLLDGLGSSEAHNIGTSVTTAENVKDPRPRFLFGANTLLVDEQLNSLSIEPGAKGMIAVAGARPIGYYKDRSKSAQTFMEIDGKECALPGDWAQVNEDGTTFTLLGRGSQCINTGGEKVFPEEVETALRRYGAVKDAVVVGVPDERWGQAVVALVSGVNSAVDTDQLHEFVKGQLANYKAPKHYLNVAEVWRSPAGKADYKKALSLALNELG